MGVTVGVMLGVGSGVLVGVGEGSGFSISKSPKATNR